MSDTVLSDTEALLMRTVEQAREHYGEDINFSADDEVGEEDEIIEYPPAYFIPNAEAVQPILLLPSLLLQNDE